MKHFKKVTIITIFLAIAGISFTTYAESQDVNDATGVIDTVITLNQAASTALEIVPGTIAKIEFSNDDDNYDRAVWEIEIVDNQKITHDIEIDANAGTIIKNEVDRNDDSDIDKDDGEENEKADNDHAMIKIVQPLRMKHHPAHHPS